MKTYELTYIIDAQIPPEKQEEVTAKFLELLTSLGAEVLNVEKWGKKKLAFQIEDRQYGFYVMLQFRLQATAVSQIEHYLRLSPHIFRHLVLLRDPRTLKKIRFEQERLAKEVLFNVEKERNLIPDRIVEVVVPPEVLIAAGLIESDDLDKTDNGLSEKE
ncbi:MAG: 30S ribosomal protein S6 [bacterium]|nr:30S ribosomal protein S6 [bacterium]